MGNGKKSCLVTLWEWGSAGSFLQLLPVFCSLCSLEEGGSAVLISRQWLIGVTPVPVTSRLPRSPRPCSMPWAPTPWPPSTSARTSSGRFPQGTAGMEGHSQLGFALLPLFPACCSPPELFGHTDPSQCGEALVCRWGCAVTGASHSQGEAFPGTAGNQ